MKSRLIFFKLHAAQAPEASGRSCIKGEEQWCGMRRTGSGSPIVRLRRQRGGRTSIHVLRTHRVVHKSIGPVDRWVERSRARSLALWLCARPLIVCILAHSICALSSISIAACGNVEAQSTNVRGHLPRDGRAGLGRANRERTRRRDVKGCLCGGGAGDKRAMAGNSVDNRTHDRG